MEQLPDADAFKALSETLKPDVRIGFFQRWDKKTGKFCPITLKDMHEELLCLQLNKNVPISIRTQYDTARNLCLYAWFVYRFYPVAEHQALTCLEFALREKFSTEPNSNIKAGLSALLKHARDKNFIRNEHFKVWRDHVRARSEWRYKNEKLRELEKNNLSEIELDYDKATAIEEDKNWDYVSLLVKNLPAIRNEYAHGGSILHNGVFSTFQIVYEIINQVFSK